MVTPHTSSLAFNYIAKLSPYRDISASCYTLTHVPSFLCLKVAQMFFITFFVLCVLYYMYDLYNQINM